MAIVVGVWLRNNLDLMTLAAQILNQHTVIEITASECLQLVKNHYANTQLMFLSIGGIDTDVAR